MVVLSGCTTAPPVIPVATPAPEGVATYTVIRGDTLYSIAFRYDLDYQQLAEWNQLKSPDLIFAGQTLRLSPPDGTDAALPVVAVAAAAPTTARPAFATPPRPPQKPSVPTRRPATEPVQVAAATPSALPVPVAAPAVPVPVPAPTPAPAAAPAATPVVAVVTPPPAPAPAPAPAAKSRTVSGLPWVWPTDGGVIRSYQPDVPGRKGIQIGGKQGQNIRAAAAGQVVYSGSGLPGYGRLIIVKHSNSLLSAYGYLGEIYVKEGDKVKSGQSIAEIGTSTDNRPVLHFEIRQNGKPVNPMNFLPS